MSCSLIRALKRVFLFGIFTSFICIGRSEAAVSQLLASPDFQNHPPSTANSVPWAAGGGAYLNQWADWFGKPFMYFEAWWNPGQKYDPWFGQTVTFLKTDGDTFTASFRAKFESNFRAERTIISFQTSAGMTLSTSEITSLVNQRKGADWGIYSATYKVPAGTMSTIAPNGTSGQMRLVIQSIQHEHVSESGAAFFDDITLSQSTSPLFQRLLYR